MKCAIAAGLLMSSMIASDGWAKKYVYGPVPDWETYKTLADAAVRAQLPDPDNWIVTWPYGYSQAGWPGPKNVRGYLTCGLMQARVPVPNRDPVTMLTVVIDYGEVKNVDFATRQRNHRVNVICPLDQRRPECRPLV